jgi:hypothetical protein
LNCCGNNLFEDDPFENLIELSCSDGHDNDCDGFIDDADSDCPLIVTLLRPENGKAYYGTSIYLQVKTNKPTYWINYSLDSTGYVNKWTNQPAGTYGTYIYVPNYGSHNIVVKAKANPSGAVIESGTVYFTTNRLGGGCGSRFVHCLMT